MKTTHATRIEARTTLVEEGFQHAFSSPGRPELWIKGKLRKAVARRTIEADQDWVIVDYPEPSVCRAVDLPALVERDGYLLVNGKETHAARYVEVNEPMPDDENLDLL